MLESPGPVLESPDPLTAFKALSGMLTEESEKEATPDGVGMASLSSSWWGKSLTFSRESWTEKNK